MSLLKSSQDIAKLRVAGRHLAAVLSLAHEAATPGTTLIELDRKIDAWIRERGCKPSFLGHEGFPNSACLSVNDEVVHGIPDERVLKEGDVLGIDGGLWLDNVCVDSAITVGVGSITPEAQALLDDTKEALAAGLAAIKPFRSRVGAISSAVQQVAEARGRGIVRSLTGHGVGHKVWESPDIPNFGSPSDGIQLRPGMVLAIEPMLTAGAGEVYTDIDGWTVVTVDHSLSAQFEHTILVTQRGVEILV
jgi:methionyl aminopeptidase